MRIAVDFDGTIVEHKYPKIGKLMPFAIETLIELQKQGYELVLWTYRAGKYLDEAVEFCRERGLEFYAVNKNSPDEILDECNISRKIYADIYIDDRNIGGFPGWSYIWKLLNKNDPFSAGDDYEIFPLKKKETFSGKIKKILSSINY
jgi:hydroxymethylpyrimidine pyrophosphatase-like HAD family hydrolase